MTPLWARKSLAWFRSLVREVPEDIARCEFECRKPQCRHGEWESCERRLTYMKQARGEPQPAPDPGRTS